MKHMSDSAKVLQDHLHDLLNHMSTTIDCVKNWPEDQSSTVHLERTSTLIQNIRETIDRLQAVEGVVKTDLELRKQLEECKIPLDLLDLLDHGGGLNPVCFARGMLKEALGQLAGLKRRKLAMDLLSKFVEAGIQQRQKQRRMEMEAEAQPGEAEHARSPDSGVMEEPPAKRQCKEE